VLAEESGPPEEQRVSTNDSIGLSHIRVASARCNCTWMTREGSSAVGFDKSVRDEEEV